MAATLSPLFLSSLNQPQLQFHCTTHFKSCKTPFFFSKQTNPFQIFKKIDRYYTILSFSTSQSSSSSPTLLDPLKTTRILTNKAFEKLKFLENFKYFQLLESGSMLVRVMRDDEMDMVVGLLAESIADSIVLLKGYVNLLGILVKNYLIERRNLMPHTATLIGFYRGDDEDSEVELAGTVEISFGEMGAHASYSTPTPPKNSPYICNMAVQKSLRRRGIGWHLLKASEKLVSQMSSSKEIYLHCRMIDAAPLNMYTKAGYSIVETDNVLILLTFQRRKHLMCMQLPVTNSYSEMDRSDDEDHPS